MNKIIYSLLSLILTCSLAIYFFSNHSIFDVLSAIRNVPLNYLISFLCFSTMMSIFRTWRDKILLKVNNYDVPGLSLFFVTLVRNLFADLLPARIGTLMYIYLVRTRLGVSLGAGTSSYTFSFLFDLIGNCPIILFCLMSISLPKEISLKYLLFGVFLILSITILLIIFLPFFISLFSKILKKLPFPIFQTISKILNETEESINEVKQAKIYDRLLLLSVAIRASKYAGLYVFLLGLGISMGLDEKMLDPGISLMGLLSAEFAASMPISGIAGFGAYESAWAFTFTLLGIDLRMAEITAVSHHLFTQAYAYSLGIFSMLVLLIPYFYCSDSKINNYSLSPKNKFYFTFFIISMLGVLTAYFPIYLYANEAHRNEPLVEEIIGSNLGEVIFDSNRAGNFSIYTYHLDTNKTYRVTNSSKHDMFPDPSPDARHIVFSRHSSLKRGTPSEIIFFSLQDKTETIIDSGAFPTFSFDGEKIFYEKDRSKVYSYSLKDKTKVEIFPNNNPSFANYQIVKPRLSADNSKLVFTSDKGGRWHAWLIDLTTNKEIKIGHGCEPVFHPKENKIIWVAEKNMKERSGFKYFNLEDRTTGIFNDLDAPWGHEYFPSFSKDGTKFIYSASPPKEHSHEHANYQIFQKNLKTKEIKRLTDDKHTNRWAKYIK